MRHGVSHGFSPCHHCFLHSSPTTSEKCCPDAGIGPGWVSPTSFLSEETTLPPIHGFTTAPSTRWDATIRAITTKTVSTTRCRHWDTSCHYLRAHHQHQLIILHHHYPVQPCEMSESNARTKSISHYPRTEPFHSGKFILHSFSITDTWRLSSPFF